MIALYIVAGIVGALAIPWVLGWCIGVIARFARPDLRNSLARRRSAPKVVVRDDPRLYRFDELVDLIRRARGGDARARMVLRDPRFTRHIRNRPHLRAALGRAVDARRAA